MRACIAAVLVALLAVAALAALRFDISARRDLRTDVAIRDVNEPLGGDAPRFADPAAFALWLDSDLFVRRSVASGHLPLWNRRQGGGYSPLLHFQNGVMHPVRWITAAVPAEAAPGALIVLELLVLFCGVVLLLERVFDLGTAAAVFGGLVAIANGYTLSVVHFSGALLPLAHLPWMALAVALALRSGAPRAAAGLAVATALLLLAGHPSFIFGTLLFALLFWLGLRWMGGAAYGSHRAVAGGLVAGGGLAAFALVPVLVAIPGLWTYKLQGSSYVPLSLREWSAQLAGTVFDARTPAHQLDYWTSYVFVGMGVAALMAVGLAHGTSAARRVLRLLVPVFLVLALPGPWMRLLAALPPLRFTKQWYLFGPFAICCALAAAVGMQRVIEHRGFGRWRVAVAVALAVVSLAVYVPRAGSALAPVSQSAIRTESPLTRALRPATEFFRITGGRGQTLLPNASEWSGVEDVRLASAVFPLRYRKWFALADPEGLTRSYAAAATSRSIDSPLFGLFNTRFMLQSKLPTLHLYSRAVSPGFTLGGRYETPEDLSTSHVRPVSESRFARLYENRSAWRPRAEYFSTWRPVAGLDQAEGALRADPWAAAAAPVVETTRAPRPVANASGAGVAVTYPGDAAVRMRVDAPSEGLVVLHDSWDAGWRARVDGSAAEVHPVNLISRGVFVGKGRHEVVMTYSPRGLHEGLIVSALTAILLLVLAFRRGASRA